MPDEVLVFVTCPTAAADAIATHLVTSQVAACVNIVPSVTSVYRWDGEIVKDEEALLVVKSNLKVWRSLESAVREIHTYEVPEMICIPIAEGHRPYLDWLNRSLQGDPDKRGLPNNS